ncbi:MAG: hypothetical protein IPJ13_11015 [Saprospiraceae bacterium]|nr:hypothetical protein [Saprospiraceae bacterium]
MADGLCIGSGIGSELANLCSPAISQRNSDQYNVDGNSFWINALWVEYFQEGLADIDVMILQGTDTKALTYAGVGKIMKAYAFSQLVDVFGDVPFLNIMISKKHQHQNLMMMQKFILNC